MTQRHQVQFAPSAIQDLLEIGEFILNREGANRSNAVIDAIESMVSTLADLPTRGHRPPELEFLNLPDIWEVHSTPYRIIYQVDGTMVSILCVADGRRQISALLAKRLLR